MQVFLLPEGGRRGSTLSCDGPEAEHIIKVMRLSPGASVVFTEGQGQFLHARIEHVDGGTVRARLERTEPDPREEGAPWITLALSLLKGDHFEVALVKAVELGVHRIVPLQTEHCVVRLDARDARARTARWQRLADSAMKQAARSWRPLVSAPCALRELPDAIEADTVWIVADELETEQGLLAVRPAPPTPLLAIVGPEGGLSASEREWLRARGAQAVTLSPYRLRAGTAAVALLAQLRASPARPPSGGS